jgi:hypothetical protein
MVPIESAIYITSIVRSSYEEERVNPLARGWPKETAAEGDSSGGGFTGASVPLCRLDAGSVAY